MDARAALEAIANYITERESQRTSGDDSNDHLLDDIAQQFQKALTGE